MNLRRLHNAAAAATSIYRIAYTGAMLWLLFRRRGSHPPPPPPPESYDSKAHRRR